MSGGVLIVGSPNVGKSALFNRLTGRYVAVSNYPGTTVEISRGRSRLFGFDVEVVDTPGMYSLMPITEEERVARAIFQAERPRAVVHVADAKNIDRMLPLTLQLIEARLPVVLALNMWDEAVGAGVRIDCGRLSRQLGVPVVPTVATSGQGVGDLVRAILALQPPAEPLQVQYPPVLENTIRQIVPYLNGSDGLSPRTRALLLADGDRDETQRLERELPLERRDAVLGLVLAARTALERPPQYHAAMAARAMSDRILTESAVFPHRHARTLAARLSDWCMNPLTGIPLLLAVLYFGLYQFVGNFGAGVLVNWLETGFRQNVNPWVDRTLAALIGWAPLRDLIGGEFGVITLGVRYAIAIILPIVGTFFLAFAILEDSGYLPRLAMLIDRIFKKIGLTGRAVIPLVLGLGCDTMATMVTRTLETRRERLIATFLLALAVPCSAQIGVILGLLAAHPAGLAVWGGVVLGVFLLSGLLAARVLPGERPMFYMELPPLRLPRLGNVLVKTYTRIVWYFKEVLPLFLVASVLIWVGRLTGAFEAMVSGLSPVVGALGLPEGASQAFLFGFFRRDYGAAGLYDLQKAGGLTGNQLTVAAVTLTLFLPCIAQFLIMSKERGLRMTVLVSALILLLAFGTGFVLNAGLTLLGAGL